MTKEQDTNNISEQPNAAAQTSPTQQSVSAAPEFSSFIPTEFKDKGYMKDVDSFEKLFKKLDGTQELIGRKGVIMPHENSTPEEWDKFYNSLGRPETPDKYELENAAPELVTRNEELDSKVKELFHKSGLNPKQAKELAKGYDGLLLPIIEKMKSDQETDSENFQNLIKEELGTNRDKILERGKGLIPQYVPERLKDYAQSMPPAAQEILAITLDRIHEKHFSENKRELGVNNSSNASLLEQKAEIANLMKHEAYYNPMHSDHKAIREKVSNFYQNSNKK